MTGHDGASDTGGRRDARLERLVRRLPRRVRRGVYWVRRPRRRWIRVPIATLLILGGLLGFLPILGFWMIPAGMFLLADDVPLARRLLSRGLDGWERLRARVGR